jgi:HK97 family phage prohead protease
MKSFVIAEVKTLDTAAPHGEFEAILSAPTLDRDGEVVAPGAFTKAGPLPESIPIHINHQFDVEKVVGRGVPYYDGELLKVRGVFDPDERSQLVRAKVASGSVNRMSVGFMSAVREVKDGTPTVTAAELLEASFVSVPSNREAAVLAVKSADEKPFANEHACRLEDPDQFTWFRRNNDADPNVIIGFRSDGSSAAQAFRYPTADWTEARAKSHCADHDGSFEAASKNTTLGSIAIAPGTTTTTSYPGAIATGHQTIVIGSGRVPDLKAGRVFSSKNEAALRQAVELLTNLLDQLAAPTEEAAPTKSPADADPEEKAAAPAAADEAAAAAAAQPPAEVPVGMAQLAALRAQADLLLSP